MSLLTLVWLWPWLCPYSPPTSHVSDKKAANTFLSVWYRSRWLQEIAATGFSFSFSFSFSFPLQRPVYVVIGRPILYVFMHWEQFQKYPFGSLSLCFHVTDKLWSVDCNPCAELSTSATIEASWALYLPVELELIVKTDDFKKKDSSWPFISTIHNQNGNQRLESNFSW